MASTNLKLAKLLDEKKIASRVMEMGQEITKFAAKEELIAVCVLKGSFIFYSDLVRSIDADVHSDFIGCSSYGDSSKSSGEVRLISLNAAGLSLPAFTGDPDDQNASCTSSPLALAQTVINVSVNADPTWTYFASGDFNGDGIFDIVWKRPDNSLVLWLMNANGAAPTVISNAGSAPASSTPLSLQ